MKSGLRAALVPSASTQRTTGRHWKPCIWGFSRASTPLPYSRDSKPGGTNLLYYLFFWTEHRMPWVSFPTVVSGTMQKKTQLSLSHVPWSLDLDTSWSSPFFFFFSSLLGPFILPEPNILQINTNSLSLPCVKKTTTHDPSPCTRIPLSPGGHNV